ncbi:hypothetical protein L9F63_012817, partial [Diploptera punctata]
EVKDLPSGRIIMDGWMDIHKDKTSSGDIACSLIWDNNRLMHWLRRALKGVRFIVDKEEVRDCPLNVVSDKYMFHHKQLGYILEPTNIFQTHGEQPYIIHAKNYTCESKRNNDLCRNIMEMLSSYTFHYQSGIGMTNLDASINKTEVKQISENSIQNDVLLKLFKKSVRRN